MNKQNLLLSLSSQHLQSYQYKQHHINSFHALNLSHNLGSLQINICIKYTEYIFTVSIFFNGINLRLTWLNNCYRVAHFADSSNITHNQECFLRRFQSQSMGKVYNY